MDDILGIGCLCVISIFEIWILYQVLFNTVIDLKVLRNKDKFIMWISIFVTGIMSGINREGLFFSSILFLFNIIVIFICSGWIKKKNLWIIGDIIVFYFALVALIDYLWAFLSMIILNESFIYRVHTGTSLEKIIIFILSRGMVAIILLICKSRQDWFTDIREYKKELLALDIVMVFMLIKYQFWMVDIILGYKPMVGLTAGVSIFMVIMLVLFFSYMVTKSIFYRQQNELLISKDEMMSDMYQELLREMEKNRRIIHDIHHHILVLQQYEDAKEFEKLHHYLEVINGELKQTQHPIWTGNRIIDFVLNQKCQVAENSNIRYIIDTNSFFTLPLEEKDICVLLGNLLDNAIEASETVKNHDAWIRVKLEKAGYLFFIEISNSCEKVPEIIDGEILTTKREKEFHGYGLKSVKRIVKKYDGEMTMQVKEYEFKVYISFCCE